MLPEPLPAERDPNRRFETPQVGSDSPRSAVGAAMRSRPHSEFVEHDRRHRTAFGKRWLHRRLEPRLEVSLRFPDLGHPPPAGYRPIRVDDESLRISNSVEQRPHAVDHLLRRPRNLRGHQDSHSASLTWSQARSVLIVSHSQKARTRRRWGQGGRRRRSSTTSLRVLYSGALAHATRYPSGQSLW